MAKMGQKRSAGRKPIKKVGQRTLQRKADTLYSLFIRSRAGWTCEWCGKKHGQMHTHHAVVKRRYLRTRYEEDNGVCLGVTCHDYLEDFPSINADFMRKKLGTARVEQLVALANTRTGEKFDYQPVIDYYTKKLGRIGIKG